MKLNKIFEDFINEFEWRLKDLNEIKNMALILDEKHSKFFLKSMIPMIYAYWEGFVISICEIFFQYLNDLKLSSEDYCDFYLTIALKENLENLSKSTDFEKRKKYLSDIQNKLSNEILFDKKVSTKSNLNFDILEEICKQLKMEHESFQEYKRELNQLVNIRNSIAHGENSHSFDDYRDIEKYIDLFEALGMDFLNKIFDIIKDKKYLKESNNGQSI